ncbi:MAG: NAD(P)-binding protein [Rhodospirillales bacterium]|nr:NAD(P)-binding protein [Rhodospirillales bacterium]
MPRDSSYPSAPLRVAVVGSGVAGLSAAWLLSHVHHVTIFDREDRLGGHANTVDVQTESGAVPVDTGFIVYNERNYPNLVALFDHLSVATKPSNMSFAVSIDDGALEYAGSDILSLLRKAESGSAALLADAVGYHAILSGRPETDRQ